MNKDEETPTEFPCKGCITFVLCKNNVVGPIEKYIYYKQSKLKVIRHNVDDIILVGIFTNILLPPYITDKCFQLRNYICNHKNPSVIDTDKVLEFVTLVGVDFDKCRWKLISTYSSPLDKKKYITTVI